MNVANINKSITYNIIGASDCSILFLHAMQCADAQHGSALHLRAKAGALNPRIPTKMLPLASSFNIFSKYPRENLNEMARCFRDYPLGGHAVAGLTGLPDKPIEEIQTHSLISLPCAPYRASQSPQARCYAKHLNQLNRCPGVSRVAVWHGLRWQTIQLISLCHMIRDYLFVV